MSVVPDKMFLIEQPYSSHTNPHPTPRDEYGYHFIYLLKIILFARMSLASAKIESKKYSLAFKP